jgi:hypothetical protein
MLSLSAAKTFVLENFLELQFVLLGLFAWIFISALRKQDPQSRFKVREADRLKSQPKPQSSTAPSAASLEKTAPDLRLPGFRLTGKPHEILGIPAQSGINEINEAYRSLMKQVHPDLHEKVAAEQLRYYENASKVFTDAKIEMIKKIKNSPL